MIVIRVNGFRHSAGIQQKRVWALSHLHASDDLVLAVLFRCTVPTVIFDSQGICPAALVMHTADLEVELQALGLGFGFRSIPKPLI
jgi:hypothetical protein